MGSMNAMFEHLPTHSGDGGGGEGSTYIRDGQMQCVRLRTRKLEVLEV